MLRVDWMTCAFLEATASKRCAARGPVSTASVSTISGEYASYGAKGKFGTSKSSTTTGNKAVTIRREDLNAGRVDLKDVTTGKRILPSHPGEILREEFLEPMSLSVYALSNAIKVPRSRINDVVRGRRAITADTALRLARYLGMTPEFWINLQAHYDLEMAKETSRRRIEQEIEPYAA